MGLFSSKPPEPTDEEYRDAAMVHQRRGWAAEKADDLEAAGKWWDLSDGANRYVSRGY